MVDNEGGGEAGAGDMGVYRWKGGAEPARKRERVLYIPLSRVLATMAAKKWGGGDEIDRTSKRWKEKLGNGAWTDKIESIFSFVKHHLISRRKNKKIPFAEMTFF